jgi:hypothetical protein
LKFILSTKINDDPLLEEYFVFNRKNIEEKIEVSELKPNGKQIRLDDSNKNEYVEL